MDGWKSTEKGDERQSSHSRRGKVVWRCTIAINARRDVRILRILTTTYHEVDDGDGDGDSDSDDSRDIADC